MFTFIYQAVIIKLCFEEVVMKIFIIMLFIFVGFTAFSKENTDEKLTVHEFKGSEIGGNKENPLGTKIDSKKIENSKTKVNTRDDFLPEISDTADEI